MSRAETVNSKVEHKAKPQPGSVLSQSPVIDDRLHQFLSFKRSNAIELFTANIFSGNFLEIFGNLSARSKECSENDRILNP
jgi:hypothetical protein